MRNLSNICLCYVAAFENGTPLPGRMSDETCPQDDISVQQSSRRIPRHSSNMCPLSAGGFFRASRPSAAGALFTYGVVLATVKPA